MQKKDETKHPSESGKFVPLKSERVAQLWALVLKGPGHPERLLQSIRIYPF